jgi:putative nucleotidyltransferase with HDIG domain
MSETRTILIADKSSTVVAFLCQALSRTNWQILTTTSFQEGFELVSQHSVSLVIAGLRDVYGRAGDAFLDQIKTMHPAAIRVLLAEEGSDEEVVRGLSRKTFSEVIPVPWDSRELSEIVVRAFTAKADVGQTRGLEQLLAKMGSLPAQPLIYQKVQAELRKRDRASTGRIAELILLDPAMTVEILRIANSAVFGQRQRIDTVQRAMVVLGLELTAHLVLVFGVSEEMRPKSEAFSYEAFWTHSLAVGLAASHIQAKIGADRRQSERAMVGGLLHDVGKLAFAHSLPSGYAEVLANARKSDASLESAELDWMGVSHAELGCHLAEQWHLPPSVAAAIRWHHDPASSGRYASFVALIQVADATARQLDVGFSGNFEAPDVDAHKRNLSSTAARALEHAREELARFRDTGNYLLAWA